MPAGDLLSLMPSFKQLYESTGKKIKIYQRVNLQYGDLYGAYPGAIYSIKDEYGVPVTMNAATYNALSPLLIHQEYISDFKKWDGEPVDYDLDLLRQVDTTMPFNMINRWAWYVWPEMATDLSKPWLDTYGGEVYPKNKILINKTERYGNMLISYNFLKKYEGEVMFLGLPDEHKKFCEVNNLSVPRYEAKDFLEISMALRQCKIYIGSQSAIFQIAEGMKIPRLLECCKQMPNVIGSGPGFYDFINQRSLEYYVDKLYNL